MNSDRAALKQVHDDLRRMDQVRRAPRCAHIKSDGVRCGSPALLRQSYCYAHTNMHRPLPGLEALPPFEDANGIQCALMQVADAIVRGAIDTKRAALLLYALQIASANLKRVSFEPMPHKIVLDELAGEPDPRTAQPIRDPSLGPAPSLRMTGTMDCERSEP